MSDLYPQGDLYWNGVTVAGNNGTYSGRANGGVFTRRDWVGSYAVAWKQTGTAPATSIYLDIWLLDPSDPNLPASDTNKISVTIASGSSTTATWTFWTPDETTAAQLPAHRPHVCYRYRAANAGAATPTNDATVYLAECVNRT